MAPVLLLISRVETSCISLSSQPRPITLELLGYVDLHKIGADKEKPYFTGHDFLPDGRLIAVDNFNKKCIILNLNLNQRLQILGTPYKFKSNPYGVIGVSHDALCVTSGRAGVVYLLSVSRDNVITLTREIKTSSRFDSICCMSPSSMVGSTRNHPRPARIISVDGLESDFDHVVFPKKTYKVNESRCTYVQSKNTLVLTDRRAHKVFMYDIVKGTSRAVTNKKIKKPRAACVGPGGTVLVCSADTNSIVQLTVDGDVLGTYPVYMDIPDNICVSKDGTRLAVSNCAARYFKKLHLYKISTAIS